MNSEFLPPAKKELIPKVWDVVDYGIITKNTAEKILTECSGTEHRKLIHNPDNDSYTPYGEVTPCDGNHNPVFK